MRIQAIVPAAARAALLALLHAACAVRAAGPPAFKEYEVKAAFLYNFAKFVEFPAEKSADPAAPIVIGILGNDPFGKHLDDLVKDRRINGREIVVRRCETAEEARAAYILFIGKDDSRTPAQVFGSAGGRGVLTVGESASFAKHGGIINLVVDGDRLAFEIDMDEAERAGLTVSAQLQKLAKTVKRR